MNAENTGTGGSTAKTGPLFIVAAALLWSTAGLLIKYLPWHPMAIASVRSFFAALVFLAFFRRSILVRPNRLTWISGLALVLTQSLFVVANKLTTATNAIMLQYTSPIFIVLLGMAFFHYRPVRREILAMLWAFAGIFLFFFDNLTPGNQIGNALAVFTGLTFAAVFVLNNRPECQGPTALFIGQVGTFLAGLPFVGSIGAGVTPLQVLSILLLGVFQLGLSYILFSKGIRRTAPLNASLLSMVEPILNPVWVFLFLGEKPGLMAVIGALTIIAAMLYLNVGKLKRGRAGLD